MMEFLQTFIFPHINFVIFCAILFFAGRKAVAEIFSTQKKDFDLALELLELLELFGLVAFGFEVDLLLVVFLAALAFDFGFVLDGAD